MSFSLIRYLSPFKQSEQPNENPASWNAGVGDQGERQVMMKLFEKRAGKKTRGQTMVEFALVLPVLLMTMYGIMEFGRLLFIYVTTASASREAARYAAAIGTNEANVERYRDCDGIRAAARRVDVLGAIDQIDISYRSPTRTIPNCTGSTGSTQLRLGEQVMVSVRGRFSPIVPIVPISINEIHSETARTIVRDVTVGRNFQAPPPVGAPPESPYVSFMSASTSVTEADVVINIGIQTDIPVPHDRGPVVVELQIFNGEAEEGLDYASPGSITIEFSPGADEFTIGEQFKSIPVTILQDDLFENIERFYIAIRRVDGNEERIGHPDLHVVYILPDSDIMPTLRFSEESRVWGESSGPYTINLELSRASGANTYGTIGIGGTAILDEDFSLSSTYFNISKGATEFPLTITPNTDVLLEGPEDIILSFASLYNAGPGNPDTHRLTLIDTQCNIQWSGATGTSPYNVNLNNEGSADVNLTSITVTYTYSNPKPDLQTVTLSDSLLWNGFVSSPNSSPVTVTVPTLNNDPSLLTGINKQLTLGFTNTNVTSISSISVGFDVCPSISIGP
jgi:hypothetical protein